MSVYRVKITRGSMKEMNRLQPRIRRRAERFIDTLSANPTPGGSKKMGGYDNRWRHEFAEGYRMIYTVDRGELTVLIVRIGPRGDVYK